MNTTLRTLVLAMCLCGTAGCLRPGEDRAKLDRQVGQLSADGVTFLVEGGLATVRSPAAGQLELWAQAPSLSIEASAEDTARSDWHIRVENCMPLAQLSVLDESGTPIPATVEPRSRPTDKAWSLELPPGQTAHLSLAEPAHQTPGPFRFAVLSDIQEAVGQVDDIYERMNQDPTISFVISAGDLTESGKKSQLRTFKKHLENLEVPFFSCPGNHDVVPGSPHLWHESFGRHSFHFSYRGVHFSLIDSASATVDPIVYNWLDGWLDLARNQAHVFVTHFPVLDPSGMRNGAFRSRHEAAKMLNRLAQGAVDLCLYGHVHSYYAYSNAGIPAYISGGGGAIEEELDGLGRHFLTVDYDQQFGIDQVQLVRVD